MNNSLDIYYQFIQLLSHKKAAYNKVAFFV